MNSETPRKPILLAVLLAVIGVTLLVVLNNARRQPPAELPPPKLVRDSANYHYTPPPRKVSAEANTNDIVLEVPEDPFAALRLPAKRPRRGWPSIIATLPVCSPCSVRSRTRTT